MPVRSLIAAAAVVVCCLAAVSTPVAGFGTHLARTFMVFKEQPLTVANATAEGWSQYGVNACDPVVGYTYARNTDGSGPSKDKPTILSFTANGQLNGFGVRVWGVTLSPQLIQAGYWVDSGAGDGSYDMILTTRGGDQNIICGSTEAAELIGDELNIWGTVQPIQLNASAALAAGWVAGDCVPKMGIHYSFDLSSPSHETWSWTSLVPVLPMYDAINHNLNAVFLNVPQGTQPSAEFEGPVPTSTFCKNWCENSGCHFNGINKWSNMHFMFVPIDEISCAGAPCIVH